MSAIDILLGIVVLGSGGLNWLLAHELHLLSNDLKTIAQAYCEAISRLAKTS